MNKLSDDKRTPKILVGVLSVIFVAAIFVLVATGVVTPFDALDAGNHGHAH